jgi:hypothetical protein
MVLILIHAFLFTSAVYPDTASNATLRVPMKFWERGEIQLKIKGALFKIRGSADSDILQYLTEEILSEVLVRADMVFPEGKPAQDEEITIILSDLSGLSTDGSDKDKIIIDKVFLKIL